MFGNFNKPIRLRKNILKTIVRSQGQSIYNEISHNVVYLFSIYGEMTHNVVYLFSTPSLGNYQADMTISPLALKQSNVVQPCCNMMLHCV